MSDDSLPDVWIGANTARDARDRDGTADYIYGGPVPEQPDVHRYTPAATAEARIARMAAALHREFVTDYFCELCDRGWSEPNVEKHAPDCLLATKETT